MTREDNISQGIETLEILMKMKLNENNHKPHWNTYSNKELLILLKQEVQELEEALEMKNTIGDIPIVRECADVANFAMFIVDNIFEEKGD